MTFLKTLISVAYERIINKSLGRLISAMTWSCAMFSTLMDAMGALVQTVSGTLAPKLVLAE